MRRSPLIKIWKLLRQRTTISRKINFTVNKGQYILEIMRSASWLDSCIWPSYSTSRISTQIFGFSGTAQLHAKVWTKCFGGVVPHGLPYNYVPLGNSICNLATFREVKIKILVKQFETADLGYFDFRTAAWEPNRARSLQTSTNYLHMYSTITPNFSPSTLTGAEW